MRISRVLKIFFGCHCDPAFSGESNFIQNKIKHFEIAASLTFLAMTARIEFFHKRLKVRTRVFIQSRLFAEKGKL